MSEDRGALMAAEIAEQPEALARLLAPESMALARTLAGTIRDRSPRFVLLAARGTSDHAALYAKYLVEVSLGLPAGLASPSTMTAYGARPDLSDVLLLAVSQSGGSPDLVETVRTARAGGATTLAVTNNPESALSDAAELQFDVLAGPERAVAATKSYSAQLSGALAHHRRVPGRGRSGRPGDPRSGPVPGGSPRGGHRAGFALPVHRPVGDHRTRVLLPDGA